MDEKIKKELKTKKKRVWKKADAVSTILMRILADAIS